MRTAEDARPVRAGLSAPRADRTGEAERVTGLRERRDLDDVPGVRCVDEPPAADVDALVLGAARSGVEEDQVPRKEPARRDAHALVELRARVVRELDPELRVDVHREAGAVEPPDRIGAAPAVRDAEVLLGDPHRALAYRPALRRLEQELLGESAV